MLYGTAFPPMEAELVAGYQVGPAYATCAIATTMTPVSIVNYQPITVRYDFRAGLQWRGIDLCVSRFCRHNIVGACLRADEPAGWRLVLSYDSRMDRK
jgi:hypothetical protein